MIFSMRNKKINKLKSAVIYPSNNQLEWLAHFLTTSVPESYEAGMYCYSVNFFKCVLIIEKKTKIR